MGIKHAKVSSVPDGGDTSLVRPSDWNADHVIDASLITLGTAQTPTGVVSADFTGIPPWANRITLMINGISFSGTSLPVIRLGSGSFATSGYVGLTTGFSSSGATALITSGFQVSDSTRAADLNYGHLTFCRLSGNTWTASGVLGSTTGVNSMKVVYGSVTLGGVLDRVQMTTVGGTDTLDAGSINISWE